MFNFFGTGPQTLNSEGQLVPNPLDYTSMANLMYLDIGGPGYSNVLDATFD